MHAEVATVLGPSILRHSGIGGAADEAELNNVHKKHQKIVKQGDSIDFFTTYYIQHCFLCCPSDSTVSEDAGNKPSQTL
jgi:hypothetical protein